MARTNGANRAPARVLFRCDGSSRLGTGHIYRCLSLAAALRRRSSQVRFLVRDLDAAPLEVIRLAGHDLTLIARDATEEQDLDLTLRSAAEQEHTWLVFDRYATTPAQLKRAAAAGCRVLAIDDICEHAFPVDVLLNQNANADTLRYATREDTARLLGPSYALLAPGYERARPVRPKAAAASQRILVFLGGGDVLEPLRFVLDAIRQLAMPVCKVRIIVGTRFYARALELTRAALPAASLEHGCADLIEPLDWADLFVTAGGSVVWEASCLGAAMLVLPIAANQRGNARTLQERGVATYVGDIEDVTAQTLASTLAALLHAPDALARQRLAAWQLVDGRGCERVVNAMETQGA